MFRFRRGIADEGSNPGAGTHAAGVIAVAAARIGGGGGGRGGDNGDSGAEGTGLALAPFNSPLKHRVHRGPIELQFFAMSLCRSAAVSGCGSGALRPMRPVPPTLPNAMSSAFVPL